jgi:hypothetical protein
MAAANVLFYARIFSSIPNILERNHKFKVEMDRIASNRFSNYLEETFDYIVIGGGSGGSVVANRLSRNRNVQVLLLERGGDPDPLQQVPIHASMQVTPETDYGYHTAPQKNCFLASGNVILTYRKTSNKRPPPPAILKVVSDCNLINWK